MSSASSHTAALRGSTGLDTGARALIGRVVEDVSRASASAIIGCLFRDRFGSPHDYLLAVEEVHGYQARYACEHAINDAIAEAEFPGGLRPRQDPEEAAAAALLAVMPEPDYRLAIEETMKVAARMPQSVAGIKGAAERITIICRSRGAPWVFDVADGFHWVGDASVERYLLAPALAAINDPRFAGGVRSEFEHARAELRLDTPGSRKQAIHEAGCLVESAMKVVLSEHRVPYDPQRDAAQPLFNKLVDAGLVPRYMERLVLAPATPRNRAGGHGAGAVPHDPGTHEAQSVVAAAAGAIAYLGSQLP